MDKEPGVIQEIAGIEQRAADYEAELEGDMNLIDSLLGQIDMTANQEAKEILANRIKERQIHIDKLTKSIDKLNAVKERLIEANKLAIAIYDISQLYQYFDTISRMNTPTEMREPSFKEGLKEKYNEFIEKYDEDLVGNERYEKGKSAITGEYEKLMNI